MRGTRKWLLMGTGISVVYTVAAMLVSVNPWLVLGAGAIPPALGASHFLLGGEWKRIGEKTRSLFFRGVTRGRQRTLPSGEEDPVPFKSIVPKKYQKYTRKNMVF